jgi:hypothetical protein
MSATEWMCGGQGCRDCVYMGAWVGRLRIAYELCGCSIALHAWRGAFVRFVMGCILVGSLTCVYGDTGRLPFCTATATASLFLAGIE